MNTEQISQLIPYFRDAALVTAEISLLSLALGLILAIALTLARLSGFFVSRWLAAAYVSVFRGTPCLVQLFLLYFGGEQFGLNLEPFTAGVIGLGMNIAAYMSESMRGAIQAVERGQVEAARSIGFSRERTMWHIILPQAARLMIRPLGVNTVSLVKSSALVSTISVVELTFTAQRFMSSIDRPFAIFGMAALIYMALLYIVVLSVNILDRAVRIR